ncbi:hypothetical protein P153DRAFT_387562 [Dothidotthia symphoricarpi CBS 119687]|uniref:Uncharacterized protein n=1 Tax=Dothidotthia symphoricarpi CBS 119687 TaxID=1392245 RepID=A0A6A6A9S5_9PLEO|nr:uncharacterized protein P153DRAFT_387562 [Dothidotthia symphoricarpi CBS 119687]KAF2127834.1 hypothetical protein P153DRAFT_387562 [Dothidotthia symphoricarpi CBS 119687]
MASQQNHDNNTASSSAEAQRREEDWSLFQTRFDTAESEIRRCDSRLDTWVANLSPVDDQLEHTNSVTIAHNRFRVAKSLFQSAHRFMEAVRIANNWDRTVRSPRSPFGFPEGLVRNPTFRDGRLDMQGVDFGSPWGHLVAARSYARAVIVMFYEFLAMSYQELND